MILCWRPAPLGQNASEEERIYYKNWNTANRTSLLYMIGAMSNPLQRIYENFATAKELFANLDTRYGKKSVSHVSNLWNTFIRTKLEEGGDVKVHVQKMISLAEELKKLKRNLDDETIVSTILGSLPSSYEHMYEVCTISNFEWSVETLIQRIDAEVDRRAVKKQEKHPTANAVSATPSRTDTQPSSTPKTIKPKNLSKEKTNFKNKNNRNQNRG